MSIVSSPHFCNLFFHFPLWFRNGDRRFFTIISTSCFTRERNIKRRRTVSERTFFFQKMLIFLVWFFLLCCFFCGESSSASFFLCRTLWQAICVRSCAVRRRDRDCQSGYIVCAFKRVGFWKRRGCVVQRVNLVHMKTNSRMYDWVPSIATALDRSPLIVDGISTSNRRSIWSGSFTSSTSSPVQGWWYFDCAIKSSKKRQHSSSRCIVVQFQSN